MKLSAVLIEDEPFVRADLRQMLAVHQEIEVLGEAGSCEEARALLASCRPKVVFLDIRLRGGSAFDLLPELDPATEIVFVTVYDQYALRAFEVNALDYIVKPVSADRLAGCIARLRARGQHRVPAAPKQALEPGDRVFLAHDHGRRFVPLADIAAVTSIGGNYTSVDLRGGQQLTVRRSLKEWVVLLPRTVFRSVHRSGIANVTLAERLERLADGTLGLFLRGRRAPLPVSRRHAAEVHALLERRR